MVKTINSFSRNYEVVNQEQYLSINFKSIWKQFRQEPTTLWLLCGYIFFEYVRPQSIYPFIDILPWSKILVAGTLISSFISKEIFPSSSCLTKYFWGLMIAVLLSSIFAVFPGVAFEFINIPFNWIIIYYLFIRIVTTKFRFFVIILLLMLASFKMSQHGAISWAMRGFAFSRWGVAGAPGIFGNAADLGVQMLIILPFSIIFIKKYYYSWSFPKKLFWGLFPVTVITTIIAIGERNTLIGLTAICLVTAFTSRKRIRNMILMTIFAIAIIAAMPKELLDRFNTAGIDETSESRLMYWKRGIEFYKAYPVLGIGYNNWIPYYSSLYPEESQLVRREKVAHSTPITVLAELGIFGFIFYYGIAFKTIILNIKSIKLARLNGEAIWRDIPFALNIGMVGFLTTSIFITVTFYPFLFIQASLSAGLYNTLLRENKNISIG
jgi:hypothetical protein